MERTFALHVPSSTENLAMIRDFVNSIGSQAGMSAGEIANVELAVDEACANVIEHAYQGDHTREVMVRVTLEEDTLYIRVVDTGRSFDPETVDMPDLRKLMKARKSGGLGLGLMKRLMDEVQYEMIPGQKNELMMVKRLKNK
jgi:serine/threonine-protein kinase RsbW